MKKVLFIFLIFCFSLNIISCSSSSDEDDIEEILTPDTTAATLAEVTFVTTPTNDSTPNYTFSSDEAGTITYGGSCSSSTTSATTGNNTITLVSLSDGTYSNCTIIVTDSAGNASSALSVSTFVVDTTAPSVSSFTLSDTALITGDNATVTLVFSEPVDNFSSTDITADSGTLSAMTLDTSDNITWTGTFTPTANRSDLTNTLKLKENSYTDIANNYGNQPYAKWSYDNTTTNYVVDTGAAAVSSFSPSNNNVCIPVTENIIVTFNFPMDTSEITADESTGCGATIQVSSDNFISPSCVAMPGEPVASTSSSLPTNPSYNTNMTFTLDPVDNLAYDTTYKIKVTTEGNDIAKSELRNNLSNQYESSFTTSPSPSSSVSGLFMAVGSDGKIIRSTDNGSSWDNATSCQFSTNLYGITFGNNTFVGVGYSGKIVRSTDNASSWDNATSNTSNLLNGVTFGNNTFVGVGQSGNIVRSTDNGTNWDNVTSPITTYLNGVTFSE